MASIQPTENVDRVRHSANAARKAVEIRDPAFLDLDARRRDGLKAKADPKNQAGEPDAADRGREQVGIGPRAYAPDLARGQRQVEPDHVIAEAARALVVLAVDVVRDGAAHGGERGAGTDREQVAPRQERLHEVAKGHPGFTDHVAACGIEVEDPVQAAGQERPAAAVERDVAVAAAGAMGQDRAPVRLGQRRGRGGGIPGSAGERAGACGPAPAGQLHRFPMHGRHERCAQMWISAARVTAQASPVAIRNRSVRTTVVGDPERFSTSVIWR
jgi:hypothetical protein